TGRLPIQGTNAAECMARQLFAIPAPIMSLRPEVSFELAKLVHLLLSKSAAARPDMATLSATLRRLQQGHRPDSSFSILAYFRACILLLLIPVWLLPRSALAQSAAVEPAPDACLQSPKCVELCQSARSLSQVGQYEAALMAYRAAYALSNVSWLLINI